MGMVCGGRHANSACVGWRVVATAMLTRHLGDVECGRPPLAHLLAARARTSPKVTRVSRRQAAARGRSSHELTDAVYARIGQLGSRTRRDIDDVGRCLRGAGSDPASIRVQGRLSCDLVRISPARTAIAGIALTAED